ncbi:MAG: hypothetical protein KJO79_06080 [Verrucomicrobiae bacterium]|nr:hypothetical protein [Verrucomicrobiae bacterium]NNJ86731.1 hypothetical protein [Akkermansiaceae bacterium]
MKPNSGKSDKHPEPIHNWGLDQAQGDPQDDQLWDLLGEASERQPSAFFARNVVREARLLGSQKPTWQDRITAFFSPAKLTIGAAACGCALAVYSMWPTTTPVEPAPVAETTTPEPSSALAELVIEESLAAAAEDPTLFTRDEVVAMIGF